MSGSRPSAKQLQHGTQRIVAVSGDLTRIITSAFKWGGISAIAYFAFKSVDSLSGKETWANIGMQLISDLKVNRWLCYLLAGGTSLWAVGERRTRKRRVAQLSDRVIQLEKRIDPGRSSSMLPTTGDTREDDV